ncbi:hypothetical protein HYR53_06525 [Candidatus Acetothermia bacterium]|nr:hypothetical protein [Candidatus Acetothermia bacterium]
MNVRALTWAKKVGVALVLSAVLLFLVDIPGLARLIIDNFSPAPGTTIADPKPTISLRVRATGDTEELDGVGIEIIDCPKPNGDHVFINTKAAHLDTGVTVSNTRERHAGAYFEKVLVKQEITIDIGALGCTFPSATINIDINAYGFGEAPGSGNLHNAETLTFKVVEVHPTPELPFPDFKIFGLDPNSGAPGTLVKVTGIGFKNGGSPVLLAISSQLLFDGKSITRTFIDATQLQFNIPADATCGAHIIQVSNSAISKVVSGPATLSNTKTITVTSPCSSGGSTPPSNNPPPSGTTLSSFDTNHNHVLDDTEFFAAVDAWIAGQISDIIFFKLVDLWISQGPITAASLRQLPPLSLDGVTLALSDSFGI